MFPIPLAFLPLRLPLLLPLALPRPVLLPRVPRIPQTIPPFVPGIGFPLPLVIREFGRDVRDGDGECFPLFLLHEEELALDLFEFCLRGGRLGFSVVGRVIGGEFTLCFEQFREGDLFQVYPLISTTSSRPGSDILFLKLASRS
jgi:hypothetical protein